jgi:hypothetical protein
MIIANPIYDTVFKYLMEDSDIAKGLLSTILNMEIVELTIKPQETSSEVENGNKPIRIYRLDFAAVVKQNDGETKKVLIELQKSRRSTNILRFRRYLAENYQKEDKFFLENREVTNSLEIVTIYFLGFLLEDVNTSVLHVSNCYKDATTGDFLENTPNDSFVRLLNHESYMIQIPLLDGKNQSQVEKILNVFNQQFKTTDEHILNYEGSENDSPLLQKILKRLSRAVADTEVKKKMDIEDEFEREYMEYVHTIELKNKEIEEKDRIIEELMKKLNAK